MNIYMNIQLTLFPMITFVHRCFCSLERGFHKSSLHPEFNIIAIDSLTELNKCDTLMKSYKKLVELLIIKHKI